MGKPPTIDVDAVLSRMKDTLGFQMDTELGEYLDVSNKTISSWRSRNSMPIEAILSACVTSGKKIDYFIFGEDNKRDPSSLSGFDMDIMKVVGTHVSCSILQDYAEEKFAFMEEDEKEELGRRSGILIMLLIDSFMREKRALLDSGKLDRETFLDYIMKSDRIDLPYFAEAIKKRTK